MFATNHTSLSRRAFAGAIALFFGAGLIGLIGCDGGEGGGPSEADAALGEYTTIGFSQAGEESSWRAAETRSVREEAEKRGVDLKFSDGQGKQENQISAVRSYIAQGVDAIFIAPVVETGWDQVLKEAQRADIPVILLDRTVEAPEDLYETFIGSDHIRAGRLAGEWVVEATGGTGNVVELEGTPGSAPAIDRKKGFAEVMDQHDGLTVIRSQTGDFNKAGGKEVMEAFLKSDRDTIDVVYAHNDDMALGAIQAIEEAGLKPGEDIKIISVDGVKAAFEAMKEGKLNATVECQPLLGPDAFNALERMAAGETLDKITYVVDNIYTADQVDDELMASRKY